MNFITLTLTNDSIVYVNPDKITLLLIWNNHTEVHFDGDEDKCWVVKESPEEIIEKARAVKIYG